MVRLKLVLSQSAGMASTDPIDGATGGGGVKWSARPEVWVHCTRWPESIPGVGGALRLAGSCFKGSSSAGSKGSLPATSGRLGTGDSPNNESRLPTEKFGGCSNEAWGG